MSYRDRILETCTESQSTNPLELAQTILVDSEFPVAGQAHHPLVACSLLAAYANTTESELDKNEAVQAGLEKADSIPGGFCAGFGADAAAIALGIATSVVLDPDVKAESAPARAKAHSLTGKGMLNIANNTGNRCCRRSTFAMLLLGTNYFNHNLGANLESPPEAELECSLKEDNPLCNGLGCKYY